MKKNTTKKKLGQFMTTNYKYILQGLTIPEDVVIVEPFVGNGDLTKNIPHIECYDIMPSDKSPIGTIRQDTLLNPPIYKNKFILTNPPYLARNKCEDKKIFDKYDCNDLYKCFIKSIIGSGCLGGILIIPINFWSSIRSADIELRRCFLSDFSIIRLNIFEEQVFDDTSYSVCSFSYERKNINNIINTHILPSDDSYKFILCEDNNYTIGGEIYMLGDCDSSSDDNKYVVSRLIGDTVPNTKLLVKCIDDKTPINLSIGEIYSDKTPNASARTYATLTILPEINDEQQRLLAKAFNEFLNEYRSRYNSLFLSNYREGKRKRISFDLVYKICEQILNKKLYS